MAQKGIYVEIPIRAPMDALWEHTQKPELHERWDLRFTGIDYLPRANEDEPQRFLYTTRIGFGLQISGQGESAGTREKESGECTSALRFWSHQPLSLIEEGSGYWRYIPAGDHIRFLTWYDYRTRFGRSGRLLDRLGFRLLIGWATAWSFDVLRLWLERGIAPELSSRRSLVQILVQVSLAMLWIYQGLFPKLLFPGSGEMEILTATGFFGGWERQALTLIGVLEILFGLLVLLPGPRRKVHDANIALLLLLTIVTLVGQPDLFVAPFNPATLNFSMIMLSLIGLVNDHDLPSAATCLRQPHP